MVTQIPLTQGHFALVDDEDAAYLKEVGLSWHVTGRRLIDGNTVYYAAASDVRRRLLGSINVQMHRLLLKPPPGMFVDHINWNTLDNRRENLRLATPAQNAAHRRIKPTRHGYRGVDQHGSAFRAAIEHHGQLIRSHGHRTAKEAALAYDEIARAVYGEFAMLNFPDKAPARPVSRPAEPAYAHAIARAIHERDCTPNRPDQMSLDQQAAWKILDLISQAGLEVNFARTALEGSARRG